MKIYLFFSLISGSIGFLVSLKNEAVPLNPQQQHSQLQPHIIRDGGCLNSIPPGKSFQPQQQPPQQPQPTVVTTFETAKLQLGRLCDTNGDMKSSEKVFRILISWYIYSYIILHHNITTI